MMRTNHLILLIALLALCAGCKRTNWRSSVPDAPIHLEINTGIGMYVNFVPSNTTQYLIANESGIHFNGQRMPLSVTEAYGYAGTVVYINMFSQYMAYDLCCPHCLDRDKPCTVSGMYAICPTCGEEYDINTGNGAPLRGIADEPLKQYMTTYDQGTGKLFVNRGYR